MLRSHAPDEKCSPSLSHGVLTEHQQFARGPWQQFQQRCKVFRLPRQCPALRSSVPPYMISQVCMRSLHESLDFSSHAFLVQTQAAPRLPCLFSK